jgi:hypothetical protein
LIITGGHLTSGSAPSRLPVVKARHELSCVNTRRTRRSATMIACEGC